MKFLNDLRFQKDFLKRNKSYLKKGVFVLHENLRTYVLKERKKDTWFPGTKRTLKSKIKSSVARLFYSVQVRKSGDDFSAQAVYFSTVPHVYNRDAKFFDYEGKRVRTVCQNKVRYDLYMRNRTYFEKYFPMVDLLSADEERLVFEERLIDKISVPKDAWESVFRTIFDTYSTYYQLSEIDKTRVAYRCAQISESAAEAPEFTTTLFRQHGDLSSDNFIYDKNGKVFFIDYDHANYYPVFYDLFFLIVNLHLWKGNDIGIRLLTRGAFDAYFTDLSENGISSIHDAFFLFADYYLSVCQKEGLSSKWIAKYKAFLCDTLERLKR